MTEDELVCRMLFRWTARWWTCQELLSDLGVAYFPECVSESRNQAVSFGRWLAYRRGKTIGDWRIEGKGSGGAVVRWRVVADLL